MSSLFHLRTIKMLCFLDVKYTCIMHLLFDKKRKLFIFSNCKQVYLYLHKFTKTHQVNIQEKTLSKLKFPTKRDLHPILE